jgi:hypothetical protein
MGVTICIVRETDPAETCGPQVPEIIARSRAEDCS